MAKELTKTDVEQWLNAQIGAKAILSMELKLTDGRNMRNLAGLQNYLHIDNVGFREIAKLLGVDIMHKSRLPQDKDYPHELTFDYHGMLVKAIESDDDYVKYGAVE